MSADTGKGADLYGIKTHIGGKEETVKHAHMSPDLVLTMHGSTFDPNTLQNLARGGRIGGNLFPKTLQLI